MDYSKMNLQEIASDPEKLKKFAKDYAEMIDGLSFEVLNIMKKYMQHVETYAGHDFIRDTDGEYFGRDDIITDIEWEVLKAMSASKHKLITEEQWKNKPDDLTF